MRAPSCKNPRTDWSNAMLLDDGLCCLDFAKSWQAETIALSDAIVIFFVIVPVWPVHRFKVSSYPGERISYVEGGIICRLSFTPRSLLAFLYKIKYYLKATW